MLSLEELQRLFTSARNLKHRALLMTTYAAGLRVSEVVRLQLTDIETDRMLLRVNQGKGRKDRAIATAQKSYYHAQRAAGITHGKGIHTLRHASSHAASFVNHADLFPRPSLLGTAG